MDRVGNDGGWNRVGVGGSAVCSGPDSGTCQQTEPGAENIDPEMAKTGLFNRVDGGGIGMGYFATLILQSYQHL